MDKQTRTGCIQMGDKCLFTANHDTRTVPVPLYKHISPNDISQHLARRINRTSKRRVSGHCPVGMGVCPGGRGGWAGGRMCPPLRDNSVISSLSASISCACSWTSCTSRCLSRTSAFLLPENSVPCKDASSTSRPALACFRLSDSGNEEK